MAAWRALLNLLRAAARDPVWAIFSLVMSPLRLGRHLVLTMLVYLAVWVALIALWHGIELILGIPRVGVVKTAAMTAIHGFLLVGHLAIKPVFPSESKCHPPGSETVV